MNDGNAAKEAAADKFASDALLEPESYANFLNGGYRSIGSIKRYAASQMVDPFVVIGRLQKENRIPYSWHNQYKTRYKWAES